MSNQPYNSYTTPPMNYGAGVGYPLPPGPGAASNEKPPAVIVFGILNLLFGVVGICAVGFSVVGMIVIANDPQVGRQNPLLAQPLWFGFTIFLIVLGAVLTVMMIAAGVLLLMDHRFGRQLTVIYGWCSIGSRILSFLGFIVSVVIFLSGQEHNQETIMLVLVGGVPQALGDLIGMIYPILAIYFLTRKNVVAYFDRKTNN